MSNIGNKETMAKNLKYYIEKSGKDRKELAEIWGFPYSTITEWINGKKYPRIDRIEVMAEYFGILKSDLIEERTAERMELQSNNEILADIIIRLKGDSDFLSVVKTLNSLEHEKLQSVQQMLNAFTK